MELPPEMVDLETRRVADLISSQWEAMIHKALQEQFDKAKEQND